MVAQEAAQTSVFVVDMPTADATLLPPIPEDTGSGTSLQAVGPLAVLGAMVEQRRASQPAPEEISDDVEHEADAPRRRVPQNSDAFLKAR